MPEGYVFLSNHFCTELGQQLLAVVVFFLGIDVIGPDEIPALAEFFDEPGNEVVLLLVRYGSGVNDVLRTLPTFVKSRVPKQVLLFFEHWQHRFTAGGGIGAKDGDALVAEDQFSRLFSKGRGIRCRVLYDGYKLQSIYAAGCIDFINGHDRRLVERFLNNSRCSGEREKHADLDLASCGSRQTGIFAPNMWEASRRKST
ncbi:hypothetical protein D9M72_341310 [compost metagenome]